MATAYPTFTAPTRKALTTPEAQTQAGAEINPLYALAVQNINQQMKQNQNSAVEQAAARGMSRSGLSQDALNKLAMGAQSDIAGVEAEKASKIQALARQLIERDQDLGFRDRQQSFSEWSGQQDFRMRTDEFNHTVEQDKIANSQWQQEFDYRKQQDAAAAAAAAAARASSGGGGGGGGGGGSRSYTTRRSSGGGGSYRSSGGSSGGSSSTWGTDNTKEMTLDEINWYSNPKNAPYAYGQTKPAAKAPVNKITPMAQAYTAAAPVKKPIYTPSYAAALPTAKTVVTPTKKGSMSKSSSTPWYKKVLSIFS